MTETSSRRQWMPLDEVAEPFRSRLLEVFDEVPRTHVQPMQFDLSTAVDIGSTNGSSNGSKQLWIAGQIPRFENTVRHQGVVGLGVSIESARAAARLSLLNLLSILAAACDGDLARVDKFIRLTGYVHSTPEFGEHARIVDAASEILNAVFGEQGRHVRSAIGVMSLPAGASVELECVVQIR